ncbi:MAG: acetyl-CoA decarbonylase/synthase complex subunit delta [Actinomycetota bacterium]|nr:acetyl-CoA decarbonylase/synthase complex subunit delta [Actinomycetota bacterium]
MAFQAPTEQYSGKIREVVIGTTNSQVIAGGQNTLAFHTFEGTIPHRPLIAMEVYDIEPQEWADALKEVIGDVWGDPVAWAKKCQDEFGADLICLQLASADPNGLNRGADEVAETVKAVLSAISIPLIVYGCGNAEKDGEILKKVAEVAQGRNIVIGPAVEDNYKSVAAAALGFSQNVAGETPIDVNMAKQLNILMTNLGLPAEKILIDPAVGALGYGLEYAYSVIERDRLAALQQNDSMMQMPIIANLGKEVWKTKEAKISSEEMPEWGDPTRRGILWETITAVSLLVAGTDILIMRHPESVKLIKRTLNEFGLMN